MSFAARLKADALLMQMRHYSVSMKSSRTRGESMKKSHVLNERWSAAKLRSVRKRPDASESLKSTDEEKPRPSDAS